MTDRGSRRHVLDWTGTPSFPVELLQLVLPVEAKLSARSQWMPRGHDEPDEARLESFGPDVYPDSRIWTALRSWWLVHEAGANTPNWDIALGCEIEGRFGLILVEAKANVPELGTGGKKLAPDASDRSRANHERIGAAIAEACTGLRSVDPAVGISRDSSYQLANRAAFMWKLAQLGVPTVLVYLGFTGDADLAPYQFKDERHWRAEFFKYAAPHLPENLFERRLDLGPAPAWFMVRAREAAGPTLRFRRDERLVS